MTRREQAAKRRGERERRVGLDPGDEAARWLAEHDPPPPEPESKSRFKAKDLHRWRERQKRGAGPTAGSSPTAPRSLDDVVGERIVIVDARNVIRSRWPNLKEDWFLDRVRAWAESEGVRALVVFDGGAPGGILGEAELDGRTTVVGTGGRIADDWIADRAPELAAAGERLWLVTSDRGLRARTARHVERAIGGGAFAGTLEDPERS
jgi:hypothetical protein